MSITLITGGVRARILDNQLTLAPVVEAAMAAVVETVVAAVVDAAAVAAVVEATRDAVYAAGRTVDAREADVGKRGLEQGLLK